MRHSAGLDDVGGVSASGPLGVVGMDRSSAKSGERVFDEARFVQGVGMNGDLDVVLLGDREAAIDRAGCRSPVLVQLEAHAARHDLLVEGLGQARVALAEKAD